MSNSLVPDQAGRFIEPVLGPKCLQKLSTDDTRRERVKAVSKTCEGQQSSQSSQFRNNMARFEITGSTGHFHHIFSCSL